MAITKIQSGKREVQIGPGFPLCLIGERINLTNRKELTSDVQAGRFDLLRKEARRQAEAGANVLDLNLSAPGLNEPAAMEEGVKIVQETVELPLCIDTTDPASLERGLKVAEGKVLINSVNGEKKSLKRVLPLVSEYGAAVIGLTMDEGGIPPGAEGRLAAARKIVEEAERRGIPREDILIDCLALSIATDMKGALETLKTIRLVEKELGVNTVLGLSNISFGLPFRNLINSTFLSMAAAYGIDCFIANPLDPRIKETLRAASLLTGRDEYGLSYISAYRGKK